MTIDQRRSGPLYRAARTQMNLVAVLLRAIACALIALVYVASPVHTPAGWVIYGLLFTWAVARLCTARTVGWIDAFDAAVVIVFLAVEPLVSPLAGSAGDPSTQLIIPLLVSFSSQLPAWLSYPIVMAMLAVESLGSLLGEGETAVPISMFAVIMLLSWAVTAWMRKLVLQSARASDAAETAADGALQAIQVLIARRRFEREQWALVHETASATVSMVSHGDVIDRDWLASQARRDLFALAWKRPHDRPAAVVPVNATRLPIRLSAGFNFGIAMVGLLVPTAQFLTSAVAGLAWDGTQALLYAVVCAAAAAAAVMMFWPSTVVTAVASVAVIAVGPLCVLSLPEDLVYAHNWALGATSWTLTALLCRYSLRVSLSGLAVLWVLQVGALTVVEPTRSTVLAVGFVLVSAMITQFASLVVLRLVARAASQARHANKEGRVLALAKSVSDAVQQDFDRRYAELAQTVVPLLEGLAQKSLDPADADVRARAAIEAVRLQRVFGQAEGIEQRLMHELRPAIERAERRGLAVTFDLGPDLPTLSDQRLQMTARVVSTLLDSAESAASVVAMSIDGLFSVSVVGDLPAGSGATTKQSGVQITATTHDDVTWAQVQELAATTPPETSPPEILVAS